MIIYKATNLIDGKIYIGKYYQNNLYRRMQSHINSSKRPKYYLHRAMSFHGTDNFTWEIIDYASNQEDLKALEIKYIKQFNSFGVGGYNMTKGGDGIHGFKHSEETKKKLSIINTGKKVPNRKKPRPFSPTHLQKLSETSKGRPRSPETRLKNSLANKGRKHPPHSDEIKRLMSEAQKKRWAIRKQNLKDKVSYIV
jgi:group I intron endonuclease